MHQIFWYAEGDHEVCHEFSIETVEVLEVVDRKQGFILGGLNVVALQNGAFNGCTGITSITIPATVTTIGHDCFRSTSIATMMIPASVTSIGDMCFAYITSLNTFTFASGSQLTSIGGNAFRQASITTISIPPLVTSIGGWTFAQCDDLAVDCFLKMTNYQ